VIARYYEQRATGFKSREAQGKNPEHGRFRKKLGPGGAEGEWKKRQADRFRREGWGSPETHLDRGKEGRGKHASMSMKKKFRGKSTPIGSTVAVRGCAASLRGIGGNAFAHGNEKKGKRIGTTG